MEVEEDNWQGVGWGRLGETLDGWGSIMETVEAEGEGLLGKTPEFEEAEVDWGVQEEEEELGLG